MLFLLSRNHSKETILKIGSSYACFLLITPLLLISNSLSAQGLISHDFNDGNMGPFVDCTTQSPNYAKVVNNRLRTYWKQSSYNSSNRMTKGAEACGDPVHNGVGYITYKYCWLGFTINIDKNYMGASYTGVGGLAQIFGFDHANGKSSWTAMLDIEDGNLSWIDRRGQGNSRADVIVYENFPRGVDVDIIIHTVLSDIDEGQVEIFVNGNLEYSAYNITIGMGEYDSNDFQTNQSSTEFKIGQYNHSDASDNEIRIVDYDNISWYDGIDGYDIVNPNNKDTPTCDGHDSFSRIEAEDYCDKSGILTEESSEGTENVGWIENGDWIMFESVDLTNANSIDARVASNQEESFIEVRLDNPEGSLIGTLTVLNTLDDQKWDTVQSSIKNTLGEHTVYLVFKGGSGYLFNLNWIQFSSNELSNDTFNQPANKVIIYPNPIENEAVFLNAVNTTINILNMEGSTVFTKTISSKNEVIDLSILATGIYFVEVQKITENSIIKIVKN